MLLIEKLWSSSWRCRSRRRRRPRLFGALRWAWLMVSFLNVFHRGRDEKGASCCMTKQGNRYVHNCIRSKLAFSWRGMCIYENIRYSVGYFSTGSKTYLLGKVFHKYYTFFSIRKKKMFLQKDTYIPRKSRINVFHRIWFERLHFFREDCIFRNLGMYFC